MKKIFPFLILTTALQAQLGEPAFETTKAAKESQWQNWTFAGVALVTFALGVYIVSIHNGHPPPENR